MNYKHITDDELLKMTSRCSVSIREKTLDLLDLLTEVDIRKLFCDLSYSSLFNYIVDELKFSDSQAAIYNNIIKSRILTLPQAKAKIEDGTLSLFAAGAAAKVIRNDKITNLAQAAAIVKRFQGMSKIEIQNELPKKTIKSKFEINKAVLDKIEKLKKKLNLPKEMEVESILDLLLDRELSNPEVEIKENKTITPKTKPQLSVKANHQCEFVSVDKVRCKKTKNLEVDHCIPKSLNGSNHPTNLRIPCRNHNQRAAINSLGQHIINKRTSPAK